MRQNVNRASLAARAKATRENAASDCRLSAETSSSSIEVNMRRIWLSLIIASAIGCHASMRPAQEMPPVPGQSRLGWAFWQGETLTRKPVSACYRNVNECEAERSEMVAGKANVFPCAREASAACMYESYTLGGGQHRCYASLDECTRETKEGFFGFFPISRTECAQIQ